MPVIHILALPQSSEVKIPTVVAAVSSRVASVMNIPPQQVWTIWRTVEPAHYCEGGDVAKTQPRDTHPPVANIMAYEGRTPEMISRVLEAIAQTLCEHLHIDSGNAFVTWTELRAGRVYTGGAVR
jgi:phenylpyruvate tautomerase PptA (4-oxalocrotonate tautomerase family)